MSHARDEHADDGEKLAKPSSTPNSDLSGDSDDAVPPNPPRTTTDGWLTTPKFGSAGSGGAELDPGPERD
jgi:hypothetical protein